MVDNCFGNSVFRATVSMKHWDWCVLEGGSEKKTAREREWERRKKKWLERKSDGRKVQIVWKKKEEDKQKIKKGGETEENVISAYSSRTSK